MARCLLMPVLAAFTSVAFGQGGPPLLTDDPGTPGNRNWEINLASMLVFSRAERYLQAPLLDVNYGLGDRIQLKYQAPYVWDNDGIGRYRGAMGNSLMGVKWRFYQQSRDGGWNVSIYPQLEVNNPSESYARSLVELGPRFLLPVEVTRKFGPLDVNIEGGYWFNRRASNDRILGLRSGTNSPNGSKDWLVWTLADLLAQSSGGRPKLSTPLLMYALVHASGPLFTLPCAS